VSTQHAVVYTVGEPDVFRGVARSPELPETWLPCLHDQQDEDQVIEGLRRKAFHQQPEAFTWQLSDMLRP